MRRENSFFSFLLFLLKAWKWKNNHWNDSNSSLSKQSHQAYHFVESFFFFIFYHRYRLESMNNKQASEWDCELKQSRVKDEREEKFQKPSRKKWRDEKRKMKNKSWTLQEIRWYSSHVAIKDESLLKRSTYQVRSSEYKSGRRSKHSSYFLYCF